ncbi:MAG: hypothetical protein QXU23_04130, partial [Candidatus Korarchaeum sp.]
MAEVLAYSVIERMVSDYVKRIVEKASAGKKLSDWEMGILMMDQMRSSLEAKIEGVRKDLEVTRRDLEAKIEGVRKDLEVTRRDLEAKIE